MLVNIFAFLNITEQEPHFQKVNGYNFKDIVNRYFGDSVIWVGEIVAGVAKGVCVAREHEAGGLLIGQVRGWRPLH